MKTLVQKTSAFLLILTLMLAGVELPAPRTAHADTLSRTVRLFGSIASVDGLSATGGTESESGGYRIHTFTSDGTLTVSGSGEVEYLVVGGGGGGGRGAGTAGRGGGGGCGGYRTGTVNIPATQAITVGAGGSAAGAADTHGTNGNPSSIGSLISSAGGGGGAGANANGSDGGSGGGGRGASSGPVGGGLTDGTGFDGGNGFNDATGSNRAGGGGGGAGAVGGNGAAGGVGGGGGDGLASSITGSSVTRCGGGGGAGGVGSGDIGEGGLGGGGDGAVDGTPATSGTANTGSGGGGGIGNVAAGAGGSGIVIVRYIPTSGSGSVRSLRIIGTRSTPDARTAHTITANGNAQVDTAQSKFGGASALFDGTNDFLQSDTSADFNMGVAGDWVVDFWVRPNGVGSGDFTFIHIFSGSGSLGLHVKRVGASIVVDNATVVSGINAGTLTTLTWHHIAVIRSSGTVYLALDGAIIDSEAGQDYGDANSTVYVANLSNGTEDFNGWIDELRISKGTDRGWTSNFTPPSAPYIHDQYSKLLLHMDGADGSTTFSDDYQDTTPNRQIIIYPNQ